MMKALALMIIVASALALSGFPAPDAREPARLALRSVVHGEALAVTHRPAPDAAGRWSESGSLLLLATGMFGAAVLLRRRT